MELLAYDTSRIVYLLHVHRLAGQPYIPAAARALVQRYSFAKYPDLDELLKDSFTFSVGSFQDVQISEFSVYNDGVIVSSKCNTRILDDFVEDLFSWVSNEFDIVPIPYYKPEKHFESSLIFHSSVDLPGIVAPNKVASDLIESTLERGAGIPFYPSGTTFESNPEQTTLRRRPIRFFVERRAATRFSDNVFYSQAPLPTNEHISLLSELESIRP